MTTVICPVCSTNQPAPGPGVTHAPCGRCGSMLFRVAEGPRILVAHESDALAEQIGHVLLAAGFSPRRAADGQRALALLDAEHPPGAVIDVGIGPVLAFDLVAHLRSRPDHRDTKVVLVASVYNKTAYKRRPGNLYGADDYVEQHHIPDLLAPKLCRLLDIDPSGVAGIATPTPLPTGQQLGHASSRREAGTTASPERVRAAAHSIVADIALYNQEEIEATLVDGSIERFTRALEEGSQILETLVPRSEWPSEDPVLEAFRSFVTEMRRGGR